AASIAPLADGDYLNRRNVLRAVLARLVRINHRQQIKRKNPMAQSAQRIVLASRPIGEPKPENFRLEDVAVPTPGPGQLLTRTIWLSLDPYMRGRMSDAASYAAPVQINDVMEAATVGE